MTAARAWGRRWLALPLLATVTAAVLALLAGVAGSARAAQAGRLPVLTGINASHEHGYDQLVFRFSGPLPGRRRVSYATITGPDGAIGVADVHLYVSFSPATRFNRHGETSYGPATRSYQLPGVVEVSVTQGAHHSVSLVIALSRREPFSVHVRRYPSRITVDIGTRYPTTPIRVYFARNTGAAGPQPLVSVPRLVPAPPAGSAAAGLLALARAALQRLFAGPTQVEAGRGIWLAPSGATGVRDLSISDQVARVQLTGGCLAGNSGVTIATEIDATLKQLPQVRWVKIYDQAGQTEQPDGSTDSIPQCLLLVPRLPGATVTGPIIVGLLAAAALGVLLGLVLFAQSVVTGLVRRAKTVLPATYQAERIKAHPVQAGQFEPDLAWPLYPVRQLGTDLARIEADRRERYARLWNWPGNGALWVIFFPVTAAALVCLLAAGFTSLLLIFLLALASWGSAAVTMGLAGLATLALRGAERGWRTVRGSGASCPACFLVTDRPAYRCPGCPALHRDLRPGRLGLALRRCDCGTLLPTMVLRAAWHLEALCQRCGNPLPPGAAVLRDVRVPIFGDTSAGKTRFLYAALDSLTASTRRAGIELSYPDQESTKSAKAALSLIRSGQDTAKTSRGLPTALSCRIGSGICATLLHLFDTAGENFREAELHDSLGFLDYAQALVYILDPFSIGAVRDLTAGQHSAVLKRAHAAAGDPESAYVEVVTRLRDSGVTASRQRLAVVVSKADLIESAGIEIPQESALIADWLTEKGMHNLVLSARREFAEVRYFAVASLAAAQVGKAVDPGIPLQWLLSARGLKIADEALATTTTQAAS